MNKIFWTGLCAAAVLNAAADEPATINRNHINIRAAPSVNSEVVTRLQKGDKVTFLDEVPVDKPKKDEPARWAVIKLPQGAKVWVYTGFLDDNHKVKSPRLNLRAGPGENYSVLGRLERGAEVKEIRRMDDWIEIEPPDTARAYVDATFIDRPQAEAGQAIAEAAKSPLEQKPVVYEPPAKPVAQPTVPAPQPQPQPTVVAEAPKEQPKVEAPKLAVKSEPDSKPPETKPATTTVAETPTPPPAKPEENKPAATTPTPPDITKPAGEVVAPGPVTASSAAGPDAPGATRVLPPVGPVVITPQTIPVTEKRVVRREGQVRSTKFNIQAPTYFELVGERGRILNYISGEKGGFKLKDYKGLRVIVTGEEGIDPRYPERPLIELETIEIAP
jgi:uncharacterized protein YgiM (DUF1202 family)